MKTRMRGQKERTTKTSAFPQLKKSISTFKNPPKKGIPVVEDICEDNSTQTGIFEEDSDDDFSEKEENHDVSSSEIGALVSVSMMLCRSDSIEGSINHVYVKKQLYTDKQESITTKSLQVCSKIINALRIISPKKSDVHNVFNCCQMRQLRNLVVRFSNTNTRFREHALTINKNNNTKMVIRIDFATLYLIFQNEYNLYKKDGSLIRSYNSIRTSEDKIAIFSNFFRFSIIDRILKERCLIFKFSFLYKDRCNSNLGSPSESGDLCYFKDLSDVPKCLYSVLSLSL
ncbi:hypothetical protein BDF21DRAFT_403833 [Thamnidium elegans]|nr:hypothetical protein BDF21DRAFT_403833 [Thamnidium elegans]